MNMKSPEIIIDALTSRIESLTDDYESQIRNLRRQKNGEIDLLEQQVFFIACLLLTTISMKLHLC